MMALLPAFEYDIFISYRHNDNRSGWVTEFVNALQEELAATIKEPLSIYFDKNPHDGLLETHNVDKSLESKLKCLIFIPIISQTYCDPKSFAWQHEFCAFNALAKEDQLGRDVKLLNGNVASRILPVKIHDLDPDDKSTIEKEIGGVLRFIEFIYKEPGVNRPLKHTDNKVENQNKTDYRNQVNKVANAIKEIIQAMKSPVAQASGSVTQEPTPAGKGRKRINKKIALITLALMILFVLVYAVSQYVGLPKAETGGLEKSIAVLPFENMSGDADQEYFSDGVSEEILNSLAQIEGLKVTGRTSSFQFKGKEIDLKEVGEKLGVATILEGSIRKQNDLLRITVQLVSAKDGYHLWSERFDRKITDVFAIQDEIARAVSAKLKLTLLNQSPTTTRNQEAYDLYLKGRHLFNQRGESMVQARDLLIQAIATDSTFSQAYATLALNYAAMGFYYMIPSSECIPEATKFARRAIALDPNSSDAYSALGFIEIHFERNWAKAKEMATKAVELSPNNANAINLLGNFYHFFEKDLKKAESLYKEAISVDPLYFAPYVNIASLWSDDPSKALKYADNGLELNKASMLALTFKARLLWASKKEAEAIDVLKHGLTLTNSHQNLVALLCYFYAKGGDTGKALELYNGLNKRKSSEYIAAFNLGVVAFAVGKEEEAKEMFTKAYQEKNPFLLTRKQNWPDSGLNELIDKLGLDK
jgi:TolB-like protein/Flp pilus assembly protein TadD